MSGKKSDSMSETPLSFFEMKSVYLPVESPVKICKVLTL